MMNKERQNQALLRYTFSVLALTGASPAQGAVSFGEDFASNSIGDHFQVTSMTGNIPDFSPGRAIFDGSGDGGRSYIGTVDASYFLSDFVATVTVNLTSSLSSSSAAFFGLGRGIEGATFSGSSEGAVVNSFNEPSFGPSVYMNISSQVRVADWNSSNTTGNARVFGTVGSGSLGEGAHRLRIAYDSSAQTLSFSTDDNNDGSGFDQFVATVDISDNGFDGTNARLFFGGANSVSFDDFVVVPEPSAIALVSLGGLMLLRRRRVAGSR